MQKNQITHPNWTAEWIWADSPEASPRNEWRCFRKKFRLQAADLNLHSATLKLTADSRYVLYVNGVLAGRGPVRSWPFELAYDEIPVGHLLKPDAENTIAVLVMHYGVANFQYLRGRGGLLAQLEATPLHTENTQANNKTILTTDSTWITSLHLGHDPHSSRISCQLAFTEIMDARAMDDSWTKSDYDDAGWTQAEGIGPVGMEPWVKLVERDIPYLTEELIYPARIESLSFVKPVPWAAVLDLRAQLDPESINHANNVAYTGYLATVIRTSKPVRCTIGSVDEGRTPLRISVNGTPYPEEAFTGKLPERYLTVDLPAGDSFVLFDVSASTHGHGFHLGFDCGGEDFEIVRPAWGGTSIADSASIDSPFLTIGPFDAVEIIDHQETRPLREDDPDFERAARIASAAELADFAPWIRPMPGNLVNLHDVFGANVWRTAAVAQPVPLQLQNAVLASPDPATIPTRTSYDTEIVIDFGRELSGYIQFELQAAAGTIVDGYGVEYSRDGRQQHTYKLDNTFRYICVEGRQSYTSYVRRGLRYLTLTIRGTCEPVQLYNITMLQSNYPVADIGRFHCSDPLLNDIWAISRHTTRVCMEDTFVDCPAFEQAYWVGDARNEALVNYYVFGAKEIVERCLRLVPGSAFQTPLYADQVPSGWNSVIPNWTLFWINACREYYEYSGDKSFAVTMYPHISLTLDAYLSLLDEQGLLRMKGWNLLDWAAFEQPHEGVVTPQNMFLVQALRGAAQLAAVAGDVSGQRYEEQAESLKAAINRYLWDEARQAYVDCIHADGQPSRTTSMQTQVTACLCGVAEGDRAQKLEHYLLHPPASFVQIGSPFMSFFYYEALVKNGRYRELLDDMRTQYGVMIDNEATTCWEMYPSSNFNDNLDMLTRSHCHAWSAGPAYFLGAYVLGVRGTSPGWSTVTVAPQPSGLSWARGAVPLPQGGRIDVAWRADEANKRLHLRITSPSQVDLDAIAPEGYELLLERTTVG
ncbi:family 78 glycoside hydrolase catalytic domain [Paenibacillus koleovorans]|uniref:family 78 glycoside hydrolase catalytic domain n=1 Tax=Paenibacillus koleovorans TaxID=121608 RepID=UPI000FDA84DC|nr:family 78 glycoside hydrolase catalytic domain [Paenibacillus koleovorans]